MRFLLAFKDDIAFALKKAYDTDFDDEAIILAKAANIVRRDMMNMNTRTFNGSFDTQCQQLCERSFHGFLLWTTRTMPVGYRFMYVM